MERLPKARNLRAFVLADALLINPTQQLLTHGDIAGLPLSWLPLKAKLWVRSQDYFCNISTSRHIKMVSIGKH
jgi:hypothetical protein